MVFIKGKTIDGNVELIALEKVLSITPETTYTKILTGPGMYWRMKKDTIEIVDLSWNELAEVMRK